MQLLVGFKMSFITVNRGHRKLDGQQASQFLSGIGSACCNPSDWGDGIRGWHEAGRPPK